MKKNMQKISGQELLNIFTYSVAGFIMSARTSAFSGIQEEYLLQYSSISVLILVSGLLMQSSTFLAGFTIRRFGHRINIAFSLAVFSVSLAMIYISASFTCVFASFCLMMAGFGILVLSLNMYTGNLSSGDPGAAIMRLHLGFSLGALLGPRAISLLITGGYGWRNIYIPSAAAAAVLGAAYFTLAFKERHRGMGNQPYVTGSRAGWGTAAVKHSADTSFHADDNGKGELTCIKSSVNTVDPQTALSLPKGNELKKTIILFTVIFTAGQIWEYGFGTWFIIFAKKHFSLSELSASGYLTLFWVFFPVSRISAGYIVRKTGAVNLLTASFIIVFVTAASGFILRNPVLFSASGLFTALLYPLTMTLMQNTLGRERSDLIGLISMTGGLINYLLIAFAGVIGDSYGIPAGFASTGIYLTAGAAASVLFGKKRRP